MKLYKYTVAGKGYFPVDMLRYDCCWPASQEDVPELRDFTDRTATRRITLCGLGTPTTGRWNSFGWMVLPGVETFKR